MRLDVGEARSQVVHVNLAATIAEEENRIEPNRKLHPPRNGRVQPFAHPLGFSSSAFVEAISADSDSISWSCAALTKPRL